MERCGAPAIAWTGISKGHKITMDTFPLIGTLPSAAICSRNSSSRGAMTAPGKGIATQRCTYASVSEHKACQVRQAGDLTSEEGAYERKS